MVWWDFLTEVDRTRSPFVPWHSSCPDRSQLWNLTVSCLKVTLSCHKMWQHNIISCHTTLGQPEGPYISSSSIFQSLCLRAERGNCSALFNLLVYYIFIESDPIVLVSALYWFVIMLSRFINIITSNLYGHSWTFNCCKFKLSDNNYLGHDFAYFVKLQNN